MTLVSPASLILQLKSIELPLAPEELFEKSQPLEVELGCGDGSFLLEWARLHPQINFLGVERLLGRLGKLDRKGRRAGLTNIRGVRLEAAYLMEYMLPAASVEAVHIYFPDPWPKRKHRKNRLINNPFAEIAKQVLVPGGKVFLRTDDPDYFSQMTSVFASSPAFVAVETPSELRNVLTDFEREFLAQGVKTFHATFARI